MTHYAHRGQIKPPPVSNSKRKDLLFFAKTQRLSRLPGRNGQSVRKNYHYYTVEHHFYKFSNDKNGRSILMDLMTNSNRNNAFLYHNHQHCSSILKTKEISEVHYENKYNHH